MTKDLVNLNSPLKEILPLNHQATSRRANPISEDLNAYIFYIFFYLLNERAIRLKFKFNFFFKKV